MSLTNKRADFFRATGAAPITGRLARAGDYLALTKPRVMSLVVFTAAVALLIAPASVGAVTAVAVLLCIATGAGAAGALNMWYDADVDALMRRTAERPIPRGRVSRRETVVFGVAMAASSVAGLAAVANVAAAALLAFTIFFYVVIYTMWLKRFTPQSIVIGGAAGAAPPAIAWVAATGQFGVEPLILFLIIFFFWTPPHFWALALNRAGDYRRAGIPALPVVAGEQQTRQQILGYALLLLPVSLFPWAFGFARGLYAAIAVISGASLVLLAFRLGAKTETRRIAAARHLFAFSIPYLVLLFAALLIERIWLTE